MKRILFTSILFLELIIANAQTAALSFVNPTTIGNKFRIMLRMASVGGDFGLGSNNLHFNYPVTTLSNPVLVAENFPSPAFNATTSTANSTQGIVSINTAYASTTPANSNALPITSAGVNLATIEFTILNSTITGSLTWRASGSNPKVAIVDDDKLTVRIVSSALGLYIASFYFPTNAGTDVISYCNSGAITLTASGGTGGYVWSTGQTATSINVNPTVTTTYSVTASDGTHDDVAVIKTNVVTLGTDKTVTCTNPLATLTANCGSGSYTWSTGETTASINVSPSITTTYKVTSTDGSTDNIIVFVDKTVVANAGADVTVNCAIPTKTITASGGISYIWNNGVALASFNASPSITTTYKVTVTAANGCSATDEVIVSVYKTQPTANAGPDVSINCYNPDVTLIGSGTGIGLQYTWDDYYVLNPVVRSPETTTTYTLTVTDSNGCKAFDQVTVFVDKTPPLVNKQLFLSCNNTSNLVLTPTTSTGVTYLWENGSTAASISVSPSLSALYSVRIKKQSNGCIAYDNFYVDPTCDTSLRLAAKVFLSNVNASTKLMSNDINFVASFPLSDPYAVSGAFNASYNHVNNPITMTINPSILGVVGNNAIVDWVFIELRQGTSGASTVMQTRAGLLQVDGDIVGKDGVSPIKFSYPSGNYIIGVRHRNHLGVWTDNPTAFSNSSLVNLDFTNNSVPLYGTYPVTPISSIHYSMVGGDSNSDGSIDAFDTIVWELQNGLFDDYTNNTDYNMDGSVDAFDSIIWELNNGKYQ